MCIYIDDNTHKTYVYIVHGRRLQFERMGDVEPLGIPKQLPRHRPWSKEGAGKEQGRSREGARSQLPGSRIPGGGATVLIRSINNNLC